MKIFTEKTQGSYLTAVGMRLKLRCQGRTDDFTDPSLDFVKKKPQKTREI